MKPIVDLRDRDELTVADVSANVPEGAAARVRADQALRLYDELRDLAVTIAAMGFGVVPRLPCTLHIV